METAGFQRALVKQRANGEGSFFSDASSVEGEPGVGHRPPMDWLQWTLRSLAKTLPKNQRPTARTTRPNAAKLSTTHSCRTCGLHNPPAHEIIAHCLTSAKSRTCQAYLGRHHLQLLNRVLGSCLQAKLEALSLSPPALVKLPLVQD